MYGLCIGLYSFRTLALEPFQCVMEPKIAKWDGIENELFVDYTEMNCLECKCCTKSTNLWVEKANITELEQFALGLPE